jgi:serine/threonine-protein kinase
MTTPIARLTAALQGTYAIEREAGAGGMATVYLARDLKHGRAVAIKVLRSELAATVGTDRFLREIEMAARLQHPHILPVYDSGAADGFLYYVMPFVEGESLRDRLARDHQLPVEEAVRLAREAASALEYAHGHGIVHRDIKPENIMLFGGHAVVADFGIARAVEASGGPQLTGMGIAIGTPAYMSPEQATASEQVDGRSDQYGLACVLYEMLAGQQAFSGPTAQSVMTKSITGPRPRIRSVRAGVPEGTEAALVKALATDPKDRFANMAEFSSAIGSTLSGTGPAFGGKSSIKWLVAAGIAILAIGTFAGWRLSRPSGPVVEAAQRIAVLPFRTSGAEVALLGEGMVDLLSTNLDAIGGISTVEPRTVLQRWKERGSAVDLEGALAVGRDVDAGAVLLGSVVETGSSVRLAADLYDRKGAKLATAQVNGPADSVLSLVDGLSLALMREVWRSNEPLPSVRVAGLTTTSIGAMRSFLAGEKHYRQSAWDSAAAAFRSAVEQDSTFALAHYRLAMTYGWTGNAGSRAALSAGAQAVKYGGRLPADERFIVQAYQLFQEGKVEATDSMRRYTAAHPGDADGWYLLGESQYHRRSLAPLSPADLQAPFDRVLALDSSLAPAAIHPLEVTLERQDTAGYRAYMQVLEKAGATGELARFRPAGDIVFSPAPLDSAAIARLFTGNRQDASFSAVVGLYRDALNDPDGVLAEMLRIQEFIPPDQNMARQLPQLRAMVLTGQGRLAEVKRMADSLTPNDGRYFVQMIPVWGGYAPPGYADSLQAEIERSGIAAPSVASTTNPFELYFRSLFHLGQGDATGAAPMIQRGLAMDSAALRNFGGQWVHGLFVAADGWRSVVTGDTTGGLAKLAEGLKQVSSFSGPAMTAPLRLHRAAVMAMRPGTREQGLDWLRYGMNYDIQYIPVSRLALGRALEAAGDRAGAIEAYGEFVRYWQKADPALQPRVQQTRDLIARLQKEGG